jgi:transcriptional regulator PpsR
MDQAALPAATTGRPFPRGRLGGLDASVAATVAAAGGDIALVIDRDGVICDMAVSNDELNRDGAQTWLDKRWTDTVTVESRHKVSELLHDARADGQSLWREVNQITPSHNSMMVRYLAIDAGHDGKVIAIGRDDRAISAMQQRLLESQQAMERDYIRLRDAEARYRLLFQITGEAIVIVDSSTRRILEANPAVERLTGATAAKLIGEPFVKLFESRSQDDAASLLVVALTGARNSRASAKLFVGGRPVEASASLFRQGRTPQCLVRIAPEDLDRREVGEDAAPVSAVIERMPDAIVVTDGNLRIISANAAFLDLVHIPTKEQVVGQSMGDFLGRAGLERNILVDNVREHGYVRNFATVMRDRYEELQDVEVSAVSTVAAPGETWFGFHIRAIRRPPTNERASGVPDLHRSVEQLTELVGRVKLKELVRETTDIVERLCIEAALELTKNNRASAAEVLGLSRQSLYSKLNRFGLGKLYSDDDA